MKLFVWQYVDHLTTNYHDGGGLLVVAEDFDKARELIRKDHPACTALTQPSTLAMETVSTDEFLMFFPDAGCC